MIPDFNFYLLDRRDNKSIGIESDKGEEYIGVTFYKTNEGWELEPTKIGKGFITLWEGRYDFTKNKELAIQNADQTK